MDSHRLKDTISKLLLKHRAIQLNINPPFTWASGIKSPIYCDNRLILSYPESRKVIVAGFEQIAKKLSFDVIAGTASSGIPWAAWLADKMKKPLIYVRQKAKDYGRTRLIEGMLPKNAKVLVVEDLLSTGGSAIHAVEAIRNEGGKAKDILAIFSYGLERADRNAKDAKVTYHALDNFSNLLKIAVKENYIDDKNYKIINAWAKDPEGWYYTYFE